MLWKYGENIRILSKYSYSILRQYREYIRKTEIQSFITLTRAGRQLRLHRDRDRRGSSHLRQPEEVHRLHPHLKHSRNLPFPHVHSNWNTPGPRDSGNHLHWPRDRRGACHISCLWTTRVEHHEEAAEKSGNREARRHEPHFHELRAGVNVINVCTSVLQWF